MYLSRNCEAEAGESQNVQGQHEPYGEFQAILGYRKKLCLKINKQTKNQTKPKKHLKMMQTNNDATLSLSVLTNKVVLLKPCETVKDTADLAECLAYRNQSQGCYGL